eukprot:scaffold45979_cov19-Tisochrysis_lutea.AAC.5
MARALDQLASWAPPATQESAAAADHTQHSMGTGTSHGPQGGPMSVGCSLTVIIDGLSVSG